MTAKLPSRVMMPRVCISIIRIEREPEDGGEKETLEYPWKKVHHIYRNKTATYLYLTANRAFILPHYFADGGADALWALIEKKLPADSLTKL